MEPCRGCVSKELSFQVLQVQSEGEDIGVGDIDRLQCLRCTMLYSEVRLNVKSSFRVSSGHASSPLAHVGLRQSDCWTIAQCRVTFSLRRPAVAASVVTAMAEEPLMAPFSPSGKNKPVPFLPPPVRMLMTCRAGSACYAAQLLGCVIRSRKSRCTLRGYLVRHMLQLVLRC